MILIDRREKKGGTTVSESRCKRCNRKLKSPQDEYGWQCAKILGITSACSNAWKEQQQDFAHNAHLASDHLEEMGLNLRNLDNRELLGQLMFMQSSGEGWRNLSGEDIIHQLQTSLNSGTSLSSALRTIAKPHESVNETPAYEFPGDLGLSSMSFAYRLAYYASRAMYAPLKYYRIFEDAYSLDALKARMYDSFESMVREYDALLYLKWFTDSGELVFPQTYKAVIDQAFLNMEIDILARTLYSEASVPKYMEEIPAILQVIANRQKKDNDMQRRISPSADFVSGHAEGMFILSAHREGKGYYTFPVQGVVQTHDSATGRPYARVEKYVTPYLFGYKQFVGLSNPEGDPVAYALPGLHYTPSKYDACY